MIIGTPSLKAQVVSTFGTATENFRISTHLPLLSFRFGNYNQELMRYA